LICEDPRGSEQSQLRAAWAAAVPADPVQQIDTSALPVKHPSRVRGPDGWTGPGNDLAARFGRDGAHAEWFYGFRLAIRTDLGRRIIRAWSIVPAAVDERQIGADLVAGDAASIDALLLARHGAHTFEGLLTRTVATLAAHTLLLTLPAKAI